MARECVSDGVNSKIYDVCDCGSGCNCSHELLCVPEYGVCSCGLDAVESINAEGDQKILKAMLHITMNVLSRSREINDEEGIIDSGATIHVLTLVMATNLQQRGFKCELNKEEIGIQTAHQKSNLDIYGWIDIGGYVGSMAIVK